jgi:hypothetical protein
MSTAKTQYSKSKRLTLGDVTYNIVVHELPDGMYRATWYCSTCNEEGAWAPMSREGRQAADLARLALEVHHSFLHGQVPNSQKKT